MGEIPSEIPEEIKSEQSKSVTEKSPENLEVEQDEKSPEKLARELENIKFEHWTKYGVDSLSDRAKKLKQELPNIEKAGLIIDRLHDLLRESLSSDRKKELRKWFVAIGLLRDTADKERGYHYKYDDFTALQSPLEGDKDLEITIHRILELFGLRKAQPKPELVDINEEGTFVHGTDIDKLENILQRGLLSAIEHGGKTIYAWSVDYISFSRVGMSKLRMSNIYGYRGTTTSAWWGAGGNPPGDKSPPQRGSISFIVDREFILPRSIDCSCMTDEGKHFEDEWIVPNNNIPEGIPQDEISGIIVGTNEDLEETIAIFHKLKLSKPIYDVDGNLLWPKQMANEKIKKMLARKEKNEEK